MGSRSKARARAQASEDEIAAVQRRPATLTAAAWVQAVEAAGVLAATVLAGIDAAEGRSYERASGIALTIIGGGTAILLGFIARAVLRGRRWSRTPALLTQLFTGIVAIYLLQAPRYDWGIPAILLALAGFGTLLAPPSFRILTPGRRADSPAAAGAVPQLRRPQGTGRAAAKPRPTASAGAAQSRPDAQAAATAGPPVTAKPAGSGPDAKPAAKRRPQAGRKR